MGSTPLANSLLDADEVDSPALYPLNLALCRQCALVQIRESVSPEKLFSDYVYFSSFSETMLRHAEELAGELVSGERLTTSSRVIEIASNDGYLLQYFKKAGVTVLGIEPAQNIARVAESDKGIPTLARFFDRRLAEELANSGYKADVIIGNNVLAHVPDLNGFVSGVNALLSPGGTAVFEVPYVKDMLDGVEFDTIYHEHQSYFSLTALARLFVRNGLELWDVKRIPIHGGSVRVYACHPARRPVSDRLTQLLAHEHEWRVTEEEPYLQFADSVRTLKDKLLQLLGVLRSSGPLAAYGAAAKGVTLLSYCGIGKQFIEFVVDRSTYKQGKRFPIDALPIYAPSALSERKPAYTLLLTWNFAPEIQHQQREYLARGGKFVLPVPVPKIASNDLTG